MVDYGGHIQDRGSSFRITIQVGGKRHSFSLSKKQYTYRTARKWATEKHLALEKENTARSLTRAGAIHISEMIPLFRDQHVSSLAPKSQGPYEALFNGLQEYFVEGSGDPKITDIGSREVKQYLHWRRSHRQGRGEGNVSDRTLNKERANLSKMFSFAMEMEYITHNPVAIVKKYEDQTIEPVFITDAQYEALLAAAEHNPMLYTYLVVLGETGVRCESEALWLRWEDVRFNPSEGRPHIEVVSGRHLDRKGNRHRTKTKMSRFVPLSDRLAAVLRKHFMEFRGAQYSGNTSPWVFHHRSKHKRAKAGDRLGSLRRGFQTACRKAELPDDFTMHDLRHRRCTLWLIEEIPIYSVKKAMGHATLRTTEGYTHFTVEHLEHFWGKPEETPLKKAKEE